MDIEKKSSSAMGDSQSTFDIVSRVLGETVHGHASSELVVL